MREKGRLNLQWPWLKIIIRIVLRIFLYPGDIAASRLVPPSLGGPARLLEGREGGGGQVGADRAEEGRM